MKLKERLGIKITAIILSYLMVFILVASAMFTGVMGYYKFYFSSEKLVREEIFTDMAQSEAYYVESLIVTETNLTKYYKDKNVFYRLTDKESGTVYDTNYNGEEYSVTATSEYYEYREFSVLDENGNEHWESIPISTTIIEVFVAKDMTKNDMFSVMSKIIEIGYSLRYAMVFIVLISAAFSIALLCFLYCAAGHKSGGIVECNAIDKIPFDILSAMVLFAAYLSILMWENWSFNRSSQVMWGFIIGSVDYFIALCYTMSFATRFKTGTLIKNNVIFTLLKFLWKYLKKFLKFLNYLFSNLPIIYKTVALIIALVIIEIITIFVMFNIYWDFNMAGFILAMVYMNILAFGVLIYIAIVLQKIKNGGEKIAKGDLERKIDTRYMFGDFKDFSESLNNINEGLQFAVNEKMKSERFKTELITNVSHDIKTPLTSIINYVDLIKKEDIQSEKINEYVDVLDRQSTRLKKLVEDLVEASKASTGNLAVNLCECDICVLVTQTLAEFEEKLEKACITPVLNLPQNGVRIMADGRHLWRVFDNLMNNICKYALSGTRVYIDTLVNEDKASVTFRNISKYELNISSGELMERFVRGDKSRNTEGSGLGLSIAREIVMKHGGDISIDSEPGKGTKVVIRLPKEQSGGETYEA